MKTRLSSFVALATLVLAVAACTGTVPQASPTAEPPASQGPSAPPSDEPSLTPGEAIEPDGTITITTGAVADGPGESISDALEAARDEPTLVNGQLVLAPDGTLYLVDDIAATSPLAFDGAVLEVLGFPENPDQWDPANADISGLREADGVLWFEDHQLYGVVEG